MEDPIDNSNIMHFVHLNGSITTVFRHCPRKVTLEEATEILKRDFTEDELRGSLQTIAPPVGKAVWPTVPPERPSLFHGLVDVIIPEYSVVTFEHRRCIALLVLLGSFGLLASLMTLLMQLPIAR